MHISAKGHYACMALIALAEGYAGQKPIKIEEIARRYHIPMRYLVQILIQLKNADFCLSVRGKEGGYFLKRPPETINVFEVLECLGEGAVKKAYGESRTMYGANIFADLWKKIDRQVHKTLKDVHFNTLAKRARRQDNRLNYQI